MGKDITHLGNREKGATYVGPSKVASFPRRSSVPVLDRHAKNADLGQLEPRPKTAKLLEAAIRALPEVTRPRVSGGPKRQSRAILAVKRQCLKFDHRPGRYNATQ